MLITLSLTGALFACSPDLAPIPDRVVPSIRRPAPRSRDPRAVKVIRLWLKMYRRGDWDLSAARPGMRPGVRGSSRKRDDFLIEKHKLLPGDYRGQLNYLSEIDLLCELARAENDADAARVILEVAAVGLDTKVDYTSQMVPATVRSTGEQHLRAMKGPEITAYLVAAAGGKPGGSPAFKTAMQSAALRVLGSMRASDHRQLMIEQLAARDPMVRAAAAHALGMLREGYSIKPLAERMAQESHPTVMIEILSAIELIRNSNAEGAIKVEWMQMAAIEAGKALGRGDSWRPDLAIIDFLERFRYRDSVPLLIRLLERFENEKKLVKKGRLTARLRIRAHEVLTSLTGARIPMDEPARWRAFWETNKARFTLAKQDQDKPSAGGTGAKGFFNIPVQGKRVVFVIDVSGSMNQPMQTSGRGGGTRAGGGAGAKAAKIRIAKAELWKAVEGLPADTRFNVIHYNHQIGDWQKKLVPASDRNKARFKSWLDGLRAAGNTNIYDAMKLALKMKSLVYGQHYDSNVDEVFLLSDGLPNYGEVTNPAEILRIITETNKFSRVRINTIYLEADPFGGRMPGGVPGGTVIGGGANLMRQLAEQNGGKFVRP